MFTLGLFSYYSYMYLHNACIQPYNLCNRHYVARKSRTNQTITLVDQQSKTTFRTCFYIVSHFFPFFRLGETQRRRLDEPASHRMKRSRPARRSPTQTRTPAQTQICRSLPARRSPTLNQTAAQTQTCRLEKES
jgi:hypothetical protein